MRTSRYFAITSAVRPVPATEMSGPSDADAAALAETTGPAEASDELKEKLDWLAEMPEVPDNPMEVRPPTSRPRPPRAQTAQSQC